MRVAMLVAAGLLIAVNASAAAGTATKAHSTAATRATAAPMRASITSLSKAARAQIAAENAAARANLTAAAKANRASIALAVKEARAAITADAINGTFPPGIIGQVAGITITMQPDGTILLTNK